MPGNKNISPKNQNFFLRKMTANRATMEGPLTARKVLAWRA
jgi:hypothetical protein